MQATTRTAECSESAHQAGLQQPAGAIRMRLEIVELEGRQFDRESWRLVAELAKPGITEIEYAEMWDALQKAKRERSIHLVRG